jgi:hypothetical protein
MGVTIRGLDEWIRSLETFAERSEKVFPKVLGQGANNIKKDWIAAWTSMPHSHIPHLVRNIGYETKEKAPVFSAEIGVRPNRLQSGLASIITYGTLTSGPHDAGQAALDAEEPRYVEHVADAYVDLLNG